MPYSPSGRHSPSGRLNYGRFPSGHYSPNGHLNYSGRDSSGSPEHGGAGEAYADGATKERPADILAERPGGRGLQRMARDGLPGCETDGPARMGSRRACAPARPLKMAFQKFIFYKTSGTRN